MTFRRLRFRCAAAALATAAFCFPITTPAQSHDAGHLRVYIIDVEGGQSTLFVTPEGKSLLIDAGWPGNGSRDADRIVAAAHKAGVTKIDALLITHYHVDHAGGIPQLVAKIPVGEFIDHGPNREKDGGITEKDYAAYQQVLAKGTATHIVAHPGETLPIGSIALHVISADGNLIHQPLPGGGAPNPYCRQSELRKPDTTENARSLGVEITFGALKILDLGDLTWDKEMQLMCPTNRIGRVDVLIVSHHGWYQSSSPALVDAVHPRVALMDNGETKGGSLPTLKTISAIPGLEALYQLHYSDEGGANNTADARIANLKGNDPGNDLELTAARDGSFFIRNARTGAVTPFPAPQHATR